MAKKSDKLGRPFGSKVSKKQKEAGAGNLKSWQATGAHREPRVHGRYSQTARQRFSDLRTVEGRQLESVISAITADLGGPSNLSASQNVVLSMLRSKMIVVLQIGAYIDKTESVISEKGELIPVAQREFLNFTQSIRKDLMVLYSLSREKIAIEQVPSLDRLIAEAKKIKEPE